MLGLDVAGPGEWPPVHVRPKDEARPSWTEGADRGDFGLGARIGCGDRGTGPRDGARDGPRAGGCVRTISPMYEG